MLQGGRQHAWGKCGARCWCECRSLGFGCQGRLLGVHICRQYHCICIVPGGHSHRSYEIAHRRFLLSRQRCIGHNDRHISNIAGRILRGFGGVRNPCKLDPLYAIKTSHGLEAFVWVLSVHSDVIDEVIETGCVHHCTLEAKRASSARTNRAGLVQAAQGARAARVRSSGSDKRRKRLENQRVELQKQSHLWQHPCPNSCTWHGFLPSKMVNVTTIVPAWAFTTILSTFCTPSMAPTLRFSLAVSLGNQESMEPSRRISSEGNLVPRVGVGAKLGLSDGLHKRSPLTASRASRALPHCCRKPHTWPREIRLEIRLKKAKATRSGCNPAQ